MALVSAPLGLALLAAAVLVITVDGVGWKLAGLLVAVLALGLLGVAWGLHRSVAVSDAAAAEQRLDEVLAAVARSSGAACGSTGSQGAAGSDSVGSPDSTCASTGLICGSGNTESGCGASCLSRVR